MINSVTFENFRGLRHLELPELSQITQCRKKFCS